MIYLDNAATTLIKPPEVEAAVCEAMRTCANAGRGGHSAAMAAADRLFECREAAAELFGIENPEQVVFTLNATHALNIAIKGVMRGGGHCVISGYEHNSVARPLKAMEAQGVRFTAAHSRLFDPEDALRAFREALQEDTKCVVCTHVSNAFGYILPIEEIDALCFAHGIPLIIDAAQSAGSIPVKLNRLRAAQYVCAPGHKGLYGPQGTGLLICREEGSLPSLMEGGTGSQSGDLEQPDFLPDRQESGTQNIHGVAGLCEGIRYVQRIGEDAICQYEHALIAHAVDVLHGLDGVTVYTAEDSALQSGVLSLNLAGKSAEDVAWALDSYDIAVRGGMHCTPLAHKSADTRYGTVRVSVSWFSTDEDIEQLGRAVAEICKS